MTDEERIENFRTRVHKIADMVQEHEGQLREHSAVIKLMTEQLGDIRKTAASREQVESAIARITTEVASTTGAIRGTVDATTANLTLQIRHLAETLEPIKRGVNWVIAIVLGAVLMAILTLVIRNAGSLGVG